MEMSKQDKFAAVKAAFGKRNSGGAGNTENNGFWDKFYPFFKMAYGDVASWRFLPDLNEENPLSFVVENRYHQLMINGKKKSVACLEMYGKSCPCCEASQHYYNDLGDEKTGKLFWRKIDYVAQGLVINSPFDYPMTDSENPVRLISLAPKLFKKIEASVLTGDFDVAPWDLLEGYDYRIMKTQQGEYAAYDNSEFARKSTAIPERILDRLELYDLSKFRYGEISREQMEAMVEAVLTGRSFDDKPQVQSNNTGHQTGNPELDNSLNAAKAVETISEAPVQDNAAPASSRAADILARLRANRT